MINKKNWNLLNEYSTGIMYNSHEHKYHNPKLTEIPCGLFPT